MIDKLIPTVVDDERLQRLDVPDTLVGSVVRTLRESIFSGNFVPGERLNEVELARVLGVSRAPVREGLGVLEREGIVVSVPRRGKFVLGIDARLVSEVYALRRLLEPFAAQQAMESRPDDLPDSLQAALDDMSAAAADDDFVELAHRDIAFHNRIYELSGSQLLLRVWTKDVANRLHLLVNITSRTYRPADVIANHDAIRQAIVAGATGTGAMNDASRLIEEHIDDARRRAELSMQSLHESEAGGPGSLAGTALQTVGRTGR